MSYQNALNTSVFSKFSGGTALITALGGTAIYFGQAEDGKDPPYVVFSYGGGIGYENVSPSESVNELIFIRAYAAAPAQAGTLDGLITPLFHKQTLNVTGYTNFWTAREQAVATSEIDEAGKTTWVSGAYYRIRLDQ